MFKKRVLLLMSMCCLFSFATLSSCGGNEGNPGDTTDPTDPDDPGDPDKPVDPVDYGTVKFDKINVYAYFNETDGVPIRPIFSNPEACKDEVFEYSTPSEDKIYVDSEEGKVYYVSPGTTRVTVKSEHFSTYFMVYSAAQYPNGNALSRGKYLESSFKGNPKLNSTLFFGDSFLEFWANQTGITKSFGTVFKDYNVVNFGISGTTSQDWISFFPKLLGPTNPKNIVINLGVNDVDDLNRTGEETAYGLKRVINELHTSFKDAKIYYISITHCATPVFEVKWKYHEASNTIMKNFCDETSYMNYLDLNSLYGENYASYEQDGLHPNQSGYDLLEKLIKENVEMDTL